MVRSDLIDRLAEENPALSQSEIEEIVETFFGSIAGHLNAGGRVELRGFGAFSVRRYEARAGRNPRTGETVAVEGKSRPYFKPGKAMLARLNGAGWRTERTIFALPRPSFGSRTNQEKNLSRTSSYRNLAVRHESHGGDSLRDCNICNFLSPSDIPGEVGVKVGVKPRG